MLQLNRGDWGLESDLLWSYGKRDTISGSCFSEHLVLRKRTNAPQAVNVNVSGQTHLGLGRDPGDLWGSGLGLQRCAPLGSRCSEARCLHRVRRGVPWQSPLPGEAPVWLRGWCFPWRTMVPVQLAATSVPGQGRMHRSYHPPWRVPPKGFSLVPRLRSSPSSSRAHAHSLGWHTNPVHPQGSPSLPGLWGPSCTLLQRGWGVAGSCPSVLLTPGSPGHGCPQLTCEIGWSVLYARLCAQQCVSGLRFALQRFTSPGSLC